MYDETNRFRFLGLEAKGFGVITHGLMKDKMVLAHVTYSFHFC